MNATQTPTVTFAALDALTKAHRKCLSRRPAKGLRSAAGEKAANGLRVRLAEDYSRVWIPEEAISHVVVPGVLAIESPDYDPRHPPDRGGPGFSITFTEYELDNNRLVAIEGALRDASGKSPSAAIAMQGVVDIHELDAFLAGLEFAVREARERISLADPRRTTRTVTATE